MVDIDDRKRAEDALRESEHKVRLIIDTVLVLAWSARPDGLAETSATEVVDLNDATRRVIALSSSELQKIRVETIMDLADKLPKIAGDRVQLQQVILNLLLNSADAMRDIQGRPRRIVVKTLNDENRNIKLTVEDTGIGIDSARRTRLFDAFYTTKEGGIGIGLSVSRSIIEHHQGCIWGTKDSARGSRLPSDARNAQRLRSVLNDARSS